MASDELTPKRFTGKHLSSYEEGWNDALDAAGAPQPLVPHPGQNHDFRMTCEKCGAFGHLVLTTLGVDEMVTVEKRP